MDSAKPHSLSLTLRLMLSYAVGCVLTIGVTGWLYRVSLLKHVEQENYELLLNHLTWLRNSVLEHADDPEQELKNLMMHASRDPQYTISSRLVNDEDKVIFATASLDDLPQPHAFAATLTPDQDLNIVKSPATSRGEADTYDMAALIVGLSEGNLIYQARWSSDHFHSWKTSYDTWWMRALLIGGIASAGSGWWIARKGLSPLQHITQVVKKITAKDLNDRLPAEQLPEEITELATEFNHMLARLQQSFRQLSQFTADAAHEFRTPLNNLLGATSLALSKERSPQEYIALLQSHVEQFNRLNRMIESLLFLARADNSSAGYHLQSIDIGSCAREVLDFFSAVAEERGVILHVRGEATVMADESMLRIALSNLISNGLRFTPRGKSLSIHVERNAQQEVAISVIDSGPGISPEHYVHIFDRYYRLEKSRSTEGAGLGLSIVQTIMQLHGGKALVDRSPQGGAIFTLVFPHASGKALDAHK